MTPLISVVTPTWRRRDLLLQRCLPSVRGQTYPQVEHVVVVDGPDWALARELEGEPGVRVLVLPVHPPVRWGHVARLAGVSVARGGLIAYLDDDDAFRPDHLSVLAAGLAADPQAGFAFSRCIVHMADGSTVRIGDGRLARGRIAGASMILHRRGLLEVSNWRDEPSAPDWGLVERWLAAGVEYVSVDAETVDYYPARPVNPAEASYVSFRPPW